MLQAVNRAHGSGEPIAEAGGFDLRDAIGFIRRRWMLVLGVATVAALIGTLYVSRQAPLYTAKVQLLIEPQKNRAVAQDVISLDLALDAAALESQMTIMTSSALLRRVVEKERLLDDPEFGVARPSDSGRRGLFATIRSFFSGTSTTDEAKVVRRGEPSPSDGLMGVAPEVIATVERLKGAVVVKRPPGQGLVFDIAFTSAEPKKAARLANAVADAYIVDKLDARFEAAKRASTWLNDRLVELRAQLRASEEAVAHFRADNNLQQASGATLSQEQLIQLNQRLVQARVETAEKKARFDLLQKNENGGGNVAALPDVMNAGLIGNLRSQQNDLTRQLADLEARYTGAHPALVNLRAQLSDVQRSLATEIKRQAASIRNEYELAKSRQASVEKTFREVTGETGLDAAKNITLRELERNVAVNKSLFEDFLQRAHITQEQSTFEARDARIITPALPPGAPSSPKTALIMLGALGVGLVLGGAAAYGLELLNAGFTTPRQVETLLDLPVLASVSRIDARDLKLQDRSIKISQFPHAKPMSRVSECFRALRSAVQMSNVDHPPKVIQITSAIPGEGKTTITLATAASAAQSGLKAIILEGDLRHPSVSRYFAADKNVGLVEYLLGNADLQTVIGYDEELQVWFLPCGARTQNPSDLLASERMKSLIALLRDKFDLVLIDTPPMGPVIDPMIVSNLVDKVVFVVRWGSTGREMVAQSIARLSGHKKVAGVVFNHVNEKEAGKYGKYADSYYYYGGRYYEKYYHQ